MKEKTMRLVMTKYFASKGIKVIPQSGAGPDLLIDGKAVEVKGSIFDFDRMLKQLIDYTFKYSDVALALPYDGLKILKRANQLHGIALLIEEARDIRLKVYLVAPDTEHENLFYVREYKYASLIPTSMGIPHPLALGLKREDLDSTKDEALENLIKYSPVEQLRMEVCSKYSLDVSKVQIDVQ